MLYVDGGHSLLNVITNKHEPLLPIITELSGEKLRRADRFTQLALAGALRVGLRGSLSPSSGLILATQTGTLSTTIAMMEKIGKEHLPPKPFQFVNSLGNSACFFLAKILGIDGPSLAVSQGHVSFESALTHAELLLDSGLGQVLLGGVDEAALPIVDHIRRNEQQGKDYSACYEGAHWLRVSAQPCESSYAKIKVLGQTSSQGDVSMDLAKLGYEGSAASLAVLYNFSSGEQFEPKANVMPHGVFSGHNFVEASLRVKSGESDRVLVITRDEMNSSRYYSLVSKL